MQTASPELGFAPWSLMVPETPPETLKARPAARTTEAAQADQAANSEAPEEGFFGKDGLTFGDFLDIINPLQHLPVIGTIYRQITGDEISQGARLAGGTLFGGPLGLAAAIANNAVEAHSGKDIGDNMLALFTGDDEDVSPTVDSRMAEADGGQMKETAPSLQTAALADEDIPTTAANPVHALAVSVPTRQSLLPTPDKAKPVPAPGPEATAARNSQPAIQPAAYGKPPRLSEDVARQLEHIAALTQERLATQAREASSTTGKSKNEREAPETVAPMQTPPPPAKAAQASKAYQTAAAATPSPVDLNQVPDAMLTALKKYENMLNKTR